MKKYCFFIGTDRHNDEIVIIRQAQALKEAGYDVLYVVSDDESDEERGGIMIEPSEYRAKGLFSRIFISPIKLYRKLRVVNADVYQTCSVDQIVTCLFLKKRNKKIIFHLREGHPYTFYQKSHLPFFLKKVLVKIMEIWMRYALKRFDAVIAVTDDISRYLKGWGIKKLFVEGNFPFYQQNHSFSYDDYLKRNNIIIYHGTIYEISRQETFLDALSGVDDVRYLLVGRFKGNHQYERIIKSHHMWSKVEFIDGFDYKDLFSLQSRAIISNVLRDFSMTTSHNGSLGVIKLFESMEAGLPIICSDVPLYREIMKEYKCGILVNPNDSTQITKAIKYLLENKEEAYLMGQEGRRAVKEKYSWNIQAKEYVGIINSFFEK